MLRDFHTKAFKKFFIFSNGNTTMETLKDIISSHSRYVMCVPRGCSLLKVDPSFLGPRLPSFLIDTLLNCDLFSFLQLSLVLVMVYV